MSFFLNKTILEPANYFSLPMWGFLNLGVAPISIKFYHESPKEISLLNIIYTELIETSSGDDANLVGQMYVESRNVVLLCLAKSLVLSTLLIVIIYTFSCIPCNYHWSRFDWKQPVSKYLITSASSYSLPDVGNHVGGIILFTATLKSELVVWQNQCQSVFSYDVLLSGPSCASILHCMMICNILFM